MCGNCVPSLCFVLGRFGKRSPSQSFTQTIPTESCTDVGYSKARDQGGVFLYSMTGTVSASDVVAGFARTPTPRWQPAADGKRTVQVGWVGGLAALSIPRELRYSVDLHKDPCCCEFLK